ncbi:MAG: hypothetical protein NC344_06840 [Bacteroidales bacterium]|nr:hypothetical protein [Bacteroidales bacterium]MCM1147533.1 hypothetical protein [Bacteroidales bacterium]MCM1206323.1 hypothetical protein [Bacillota bacterium]MCM1511249.1 hypothetical protein [Clostridium sp.]
MNGKVTRVTLRCNALGVTEEFEITHAERILNMRNNGGWVLEDSNYIFKNGALIRGYKKTADRESEAQND